MTPREMTAEELAMYEECARTHEAIHPGRLLEHIAALEARAEAAEADNAALVETANELLAVADAVMPYAERDRRKHDAIATLCKPHPGAGYRARVRAELLRELADDARRTAGHIRAAIPNRWPEGHPERETHERVASAHDATSDLHEARAAREEQG